MSPWAARVFAAAPLGTAALVGAMLVSAGVWAALLRPARPLAAPSRPNARAPTPAPGPGTALGYVSSNACVSCHPSEHASFRRTYHRTMTQAAVPETVAAPLDGRPLERGGRVVRLERRDGEVWATLPDPDAVIAGRPGTGPSAPDVTRRVVLTTGSHHYAAVRFIAARSRRSATLAAAAPPAPLDPALVQALVAARDDHPMTIAE